jgi:hypothetical protein
LRLFYFLRLAFFLGFVGLISETFRMMSSNRDGWFCGFVFTLLAATLPLFYRHQRQKVKTTQYAAKAD